MKKFHFLFACLFYSVISVKAQKNGSVQGIVIDPSIKQPVLNATVTLLQQKDSSLVSFSVTDKSGKFKITNISAGNYRLLITHVGYHNSNYYFAINDPIQHVMLGNLVLNDAHKVLQEVVIKSEAPPVTLIGDTIQYHADAFKTQPNASVEDLLKKLPGVQVDKDGSVKAQGEKVNRVLVDGKEFFGNDAKIATRNLPADAIDKVQVYDKLSDQAQLTGFDDGNTEKTINLKLKKDKKKGRFGKATAGMGTKDRYQGQFNVNSFKGARQVSGIGMGNNTNAQGFSFMDILNFTGELQRMKQNSSGGRITINTDNATALGINNNRNGINTTWAGGINYNNLIGKRTDFQSNYFYNRYNPVNETHIQRQYLLPDSTYFYRQNTWLDNLSNNHRLNVNADIILNSMHSLKIGSSLNLQQTQSRAHSNYATSSEEHLLSNEGFSNTNNKNEGYNFRNDLLFKKKFPKKGRTFSVNIQTSLNKGNGEGSQESINSFYSNTGVLFKKDSINQENASHNVLQAYNAKLVYTEPVFKKTLLEWSIANSSSKSLSQKNTYNYNESSKKFDIVNSLLTNNFENKYAYTTSGVRLRHQQKKYNYSLGVNWQQAHLKGKVISNKDSVIQKTFTDILANARFQYKFNSYRNLSINYVAGTNQPSVSQLQPVPDISNPLNIREGNPDLKQEYTHSIQLRFMSVNPFKAKSLFFFLNLSQTQNKIVNYDEVNTLGIKHTKPVNVNGILNVNANTSVTLPIRWLKGYINFQNSLVYNKDKQFINKIKNHIDAISVQPRIKLEMNPTENLNIVLIGGVNYNYTQYSLQSNLSNTFLGQQYGTEIGWQLPKNFFISTDFNFTISSQRAAGFNARIPLWNAGISKQFLKFNRGELKLSAFDLLNQNIGISRTTDQNYIEDTRVLNLRRFFLLSFTYSLTKSGLARNNRGGIKMNVR